MRNKYVFDTSFVSALIKEDDLHHKKAIEIYSGFSNMDIFFVSNTVLLELLVLGNNYFNLAKAFMDSISTKYIDIDMNFINSVMHANQYFNAKLKAVDLSVFVTSRRLLAETVTFDEKLIQTIKKASR